jgi:hypothetical protein
MQKNSTGHSLNDMSLFLENLKVFSKKNIDVTNRIKCIRGWKISIKAVIHLWYQCLTDAHVHPSNPEKMKVFLAAHVLSARVAAAMTTYVALGELPPEATATIECIERFDKLFDILNSIRTKDAKEFNRQFRVPTSN